MAHAGDMDVTEWLRSIKLEQYAEAFISNGYDHMDSIQTLDDADLDTLGVTLPGHRKRLALHAHKLGGGGGDTVSALPPSSPGAQAPVPKPRRPGSIKKVPHLYENMPIMPAGAGADQGSGQPARSPPVPQPRPRSIVEPPLPPPPAAAAVDGGAAAAEPLPDEDDNDQDYETVMPPHELMPPTTSFATADATPAAGSAARAPTAEPEPEPAATVAAADGEDEPAGDAPPPVVPYAGPKAPTVSDKARKASQKLNKAMGGGNAEASKEPLVLDGPEVEVEDEAMGVIRSLHIGKTTTADEAIALFVEQYKPQFPDSIHDPVWQLLESYVLPPVERYLAGNTTLLPIKRTWPQNTGYVPGCRFVLRAVPRAKTIESVGSAVHSGVLEKRGGSKGNAKNWKRRYFRLADEGLSYYKVEPKSQKQAARPTGTWDIAKSVVFVVRDELKGAGGSIKKAKRPGLLFCLKPVTTPMWPEMDDKMALAAFDDECKFMCAASEDDRLEWVLSIQAAQAISGDALAAVQKERAQTFSALPEAAPDDYAPVDEDDDEEEQPTPEAAPAPADADASAIETEGAPADGGLVAPKKVRGVGLGDIFAQADFDIYGATAKHRHSVLPRDQ